MNRDELITMVGNRIVEIDELSTTFDPGTPERVRLDQLRNRLNDQQIRLVEKQFNENTPAFQNATANLAAVNDELTSTINDINRIENTITNIGKFIGAIDTVLGSAAAAFG
jgi:hypothetical protein